MPVAHLHLTESRCPAAALLTRSIVLLPAKASRGRGATTTAPRRLGDGPSIGSQARRTGTMPRGERRTALERARHLRPRVKASLSVSLLASPESHFALDSTSELEGCYERRSRGSGHGRADQGKHAGRRVLHHAYRQTLRDSASAYQSHASCHLLNL